MWCPWPFSGIAMLCHSGGFCGEARAMPTSSPRRGAYRYVLYIFADRLRGRILPMQLLQSQPTLETLYFFPGCGTATADAGGTCCNNLPNVVRPQVLGVVRVFWGFRIAWRRLPQYYGTNTSSEYKIMGEYCQYPSIVLYCDRLLHSCGSSGIVIRVSSTEETSAQSGVSWSIWDVWCYVVASGGGGKVCAAARAKSAHTKW